MRPELAAVAARQDGLFTRPQCLYVAGYTEDEVRRRTRVGGPWVAVRPGVYAARELWEALDGPGARARLRDVAAHLRISREHVLSHDSAARALGIPLLPPVREASHVTREGVGGGRSECGVHHHLTRLGLVDLQQVGCTPLTGPARTALDIARYHGLANGVVAIDHVRATGTPLRELVRELEVMWSWRGVRTAREAVDRSDPGAESPVESLGRLFVEELGLGRVETQFPVRIPDGVAWCDLRVGCHVVEIDGHRKYVEVARGGYATRPVDQVVRAERRRQTQVCGEGLGMSRLGYDDLWGAARVRAAQRLRDEYAVTLARFGDVLPPHLEEFATRMRGRRRRSA
jgi:hypothetical protein